MQQLGKVLRTVAASDLHLRCRLALRPCPDLGNGHISATFCCHWGIGAVSTEHASMKLLMMIRPTSTEYLVWSSAVDKLQPCKDADG